MPPIPKLTGILPPITTPFDDSGELDLGALERNLERYGSAGLGGYVAFGSNGEAVHLDPEERRLVLDTVRRLSRPGQAVVAGINELSTRAALRAIRQAADAGADAALVVTPYFYKGAMNQETLKAFYLELADASPLPVLVYNVPQNTGVVIEPATIAELGRHGSIVGVKDSAGNHGAIHETVRLAPPGFDVLVGNAAIAYASLLMGAVGAVLAVACVAPEAVVDLYRAAVEGDHDRARDLQHRLTPLATMVTAGFGVSGLKASLDFAGFAGGRPRAPLRALGEPQRERLLEVMRESGFFADL